MINKDLLKVKVRVPKFKWDPQGYGVFVAYCKLVYDGFTIGEFTVKYLGEDGIVGKVDKVFVPEKGRVINLVNIWINNLTVEFLDDEMTYLVEKFQGKWEKELSYKDFYLG